MNHRPINADRVREKFNYRDGQLFPLSGWKKNKPVGHRDSDGYIKVTMDGKTWRAHRLIWAWHFGDPAEMQIDHCDHERSNNHIENLRLATHRENHKNKKLHKNNKSGTSGVKWDRKSRKWRAYIHDFGRFIHLGFFAEKWRAAQVRRGAEHQYGFHAHHGH